MAQAWVHQMLVWGGRPLMPLAPRDRLPVVGEGTHNDHQTERSNGEVVSAQTQHGYAYDDG